MAQYTQPAQTGRKWSLLKVRGAGLSSILLFPMLDRPHLSSFPMLGRRHQLVEVFKAKWASSVSSLEYWNNEILTYWNIRSLRINQTCLKASKSYYIQCKAETCLTGHRLGTPIRGLQECICFNFPLSLYWSDNVPFSKVQGEVKNHFRDRAQASLIRVVGTILQANAYNALTWRKVLIFQIV